MAKTVQRSPASGRVRQAPGGAKRFAELARVLQAPEAETLSLLARDEAPIPLPPEVVELVRLAVAELAQGNRVRLVSAGSDLTTQQAADALNVSRPYLIALLERGALPFHKVGTHRRVALKAVDDYRGRRDKDRRSVLKAMAREAQAQGFYKA